MKSINLILIIVLIPLYSIGQRNDNIWLLSHPYSFTNNTTYYLDFNSGIPDTIIQNRNMFLNVSNSTVSDSSGNLQYASNGVTIVNGNNDTLSNTQNFNPGYYTSYYQTTGMAFVNH